MIPTKDKEVAEPSSLSVANKTPRSLHNDVKMSTGYVGILGKVEVLLLGNHPNSG